ncbi:MAG: ATP-binding protein [Planctomycetota bacterium]
MTKSIRRRLQWWYGGVYALSLLVFGCLVYWRADRDVHERAALQAISTAQYLEVSLRNVRPRPPRPSEQDLSGQSGSVEERLPVEFTSEPLPLEFRLPPLPPELSQRGVGEPQGRPGFRDHRPPGPPEDRRPLRHNRGPVGWPAGSVHPPASQSGDEEADRPIVDRMEFVIWRRDGSILNQSYGPRVDEFTTAAMPIVKARGPQLTRSRGILTVKLLGPHESTILVLRPMDEDLRRLHYFGFQIAGLAVVTCVIGIVGGGWVSNRMVQPIQQISETASRISVTNLDRRIETGDLDEELIPLAKVLNNTFERLEQSFGRLTQFTSDASHELRTPLAVIQSQIEHALSQPRSTESYQKTLTTCLKSSERMKSLVEGLLLLARTDAERLELYPTEIDLRQSAEEAVRQLEGKAVAEGIDLLCEMPEQPVFISADPRFMVQIPANLIDNAIQHTPSGGRISVSVRREKDFAIMTVSDTGDGIAPEHLPHIFERFYRIDTARSRQNGGSGLGLAICRSLAEGQGGTIECQSEPGVGSTLIVKWPVPESGTEGNGVS